MPAPDDDAWLAVIDSALKPSHVFVWAGEELRVYRLTAWLYGVWPRRTGARMRFFVAVGEDNLVFARPGWMDAGLETYLNEWLVVAKQ